jgi:hypothetical protein
MKFPSLTVGLCLLIPCFVVSCTTGVPETNHSVPAASPTTPEWRDSDLPSGWNSDEVIDCSKLQLSYEPTPTVEVFNVILPDPLPVHTFFEISKKVALVKVSAMDSREIFERYRRSRIIYPSQRDAAEGAFAFVKFSVRTRDPQGLIRCHQVIWVQYKHHRNPLDR